MYLVKSTYFWRAFVWEITQMPKLEVYEMTKRIKTVFSKEEDFANNYPIENVSNDTSPWTIYEDSPILIGIH